VKSKHCNRVPVRSSHERYCTFLKHEGPGGEEGCLRGKNTWEKKMDEASNKRMNAESCSDKAQLTTTEEGEGRNEIKRQG